MEKKSCRNCEYECKKIHEPPCNECGFLLNHIHFKPKDIPSKVKTSKVYITKNSTEVE